MKPILLLAAILPAQALTLTDLRDVKVMAETPEGRARGQWLPADGASIGLAQDRDLAYAVTSDAPGGPGGSTASAQARQTSMLTDTMFAGALSAQASAQATASVGEWGYFGHGTALSLFDVRFELTEPAQYSVNSSASGTVGASLGQVGGNMTWNRSGFSTLDLSGQLPAGLWEFKVWASAEAWARYSPIWTAASDASTAAFSFTMGDLAKSVPEGGWTLGLLVFGIASCVMLRGVFGGGNTVIRVKFENVGGGKMCWDTTLPDLEYRTLLNGIIYLTTPK